LAGELIGLNSLSKGLSEMLLLVSYAVGLVGDDKLLVHTAAVYIPTLIGVGNP
jgi:hypothetical protein